MATQPSPVGSSPRHVSLVAIPDASVSTLFGIFDVMNAFVPMRLSPAGAAPFHVEIVGGNSPEPNPEFGTVEETLEYSGYHHVCINVESLDEALEELRRRGVARVGDPFTVTAIGRRVAFIADPWGNMVELAEQI